MMIEPDYQALVDRPDSRVTEELVNQYRAGGWWQDRRLDSYLWEAAESRPDHLALVGHETLGGGRRELTYRDYAGRTLDVARGLSALGVGPADTVSVMLPNVVEFAVTIFALSRIGAVYSGIPTAYGPREVSFMVRQTGSRVLVIPSRFRNRDYVEFVQDLLDRGLELEYVAVMAPEDELPAGAHTTWLAWDEVLDRGNDVALPTPPGPAALAHVGFTSGTTGEAKGVMNTHQTLDTILRAWIEHIGADVLDASTVNLVPSPIGHHTGFLWGVLLSARLHGTAVLMDRWDAAAGARVMKDEGVTLMLGAVAFLQDLLTVTPSPDDDAWESLRVVAIPGAPIPRGLVPQAREAMGCFICPSWGMTEYGIGLSGAPGLSTDRVEATDGVPVAGCEVRIVDERGRQVASGEEGNLLICGAGLFVGYLNRPEFTDNALQDGWFLTGDRAVQDADGFTSLVGRTKDVIIRGGENIPVAQVESLLHDHPAITDVAIVAMPDDRLGERACACVVTGAGGSAPELRDLSVHLLALGLSKHYLPERVELFERLPRTSTGKIRKAELREWVLERLGSSG